MSRAGFRERLGALGRHAGASAPARSPGEKRRGADAALALLVIVVVTLMIVPLPTWLLDILLAANLSMSVTILLVVLYVPDAIAIATFPTLLLITTLFRLGLNVASTRLILLQADAGEVIRAFGTFVVRGNYVVGAVVFLVLTIIQFVVIAKGAERVAEVGARFTLDALPGKQMAIDAELRAGTIDGGEARRRRRHLSRESQFYGAMDGAMKFVKGDVIASVIITLINILAGLAIGVGQKGMPAVDALKRYGLLTIGDGLVSQIPALILSTGAGVLVTRVASEEADTPLGEELARQLFGAPKALFVAALFVTGLGLLPGLPAPPFLVLGAVLLLVSRAQAKRQARDAQRAATEPAPKAGPRREGEPHFVPVVVPWSVEVSADLEALLEDGKDDRGEERAGIRQVALSTRDDLFWELGVPLPGPRVWANGQLPARHVVLSVHELPTRVVELPKETPDDELPAVVGAQVRAMLRSRAADFLGLTETQRLLDALEEVSPATVRNVVPKPVSLTLLTDVLRRLLEERISIRDLRAILEALSSVAQTEKDPLNLTEYVRSQLRRPITYKLTGGAGQLDVILLDPMVEDTIRRAITRTPAGAFLTLAPQAARDVMAAVAAAIETARPAGPTVILTQPDIRRFVHKLIEPKMPDVEVVSFSELLPEVALRPLARVLPGMG